MEIATRLMVHADLPRVLAIDAMCWSQPWSKRAWETALAHGRCTGCVAELGDHLVGHVLWQFDDRLKLLRLVSVAVDPFWRRRYVGTTLTQLAIDCAGTRKLRLTASIWECNQEGQQFLHKLGFVPANIVRGFYPDLDWMDVIEFDYAPGQTSLSVQAERMLAEALEGH